MVMNDKKFMELAIEEAKEAARNKDVPVGAVVVCDGQVVVRAHNTREALGDATGHAEVNAIREACAILGGWHLDKCTLYVTLEPCPMCMGAIINSRMGRVVYGAADAKAGACGSVIDLRNYPLNHKPFVEEGLLSEECRRLLSDFFKDKRK